MLAAVVALVVLWVASCSSPAAPLRAADAPGRMAAAWAAPFAVGPPLLDTGVYSSAAHGLLQRTGRDPYTTPPSALGDVPVVAAIDPGARGTPSASGPLGSLLEHLAVSRRARQRARRSDRAARPRRPRRRLDRPLGRGVQQDGRAARALVLTVLNPLTLLYVVSAAHLDGLMIALVLAGLLAARRRRWRPAVAWVALAGCVAPQALVVLPVLVLAHLAARRAPPGGGSPAGRRRGSRRRRRARSVVPNGFGWAWSTRLQFATHTPFSVAGAISAVLDPMVPGASYDDLEIGGRATVLIAMACALAYLVGTAARRPLERSRRLRPARGRAARTGAEPVVPAVGDVVPGGAGERRASCRGRRALRRRLRAEPGGFSHTTRNVLTAAALVAGRGRNRRSPDEVAARTCGAAARGARTDQRVSGRRRSPGRPGARRPGRPPR